jgi:hypothetical protein
MNIAELFKRLYKSQVFKDFQKENKDAFFCAGFFILRIKEKINDLSLDYRDDTQIYSFKIPENDNEEITMHAEKIMEQQKPLDKLEIDEKTTLKLDLECLEGQIKEELSKQKINSPLGEIISVLQMTENKPMWNLTIMLEGFTIITSLINPISGQVLKFEKKNLFDFVKPKKLK